MPKIEITHKTITKAKADAKPGGERYEITDSRAKGLVLRVSATGVRWQFRWEVGGTGHRFELGGLDDWTISEARDIATKAMAIVRGRSGLVNEIWLHNRRIEYGKVPRPAKTDTVAPHLLYKWSFAQAREKYLAEVARTRRPATHEDYRKQLHLDDLKELETQPVSAITRIQMSGVIGKIHARGVERQAEHVAAVIRPMWTWLTADAQISQSGAVKGEMVGLRAPERTLNEEDVEEGAPGTYVPPLAELGRIVAIARSGAMHPTIASAVQLLVFSAQRRRAVASARLKDFSPILDGQEGLWIMPARARKNGTRTRKPHVVPLPAPAWKVVTEAIKAARSQGREWLFPQVRAKKAGDEITHISVATLTRALPAMPGVLASPHDVRRSFGTIGESELGYKRSDTKAILDHSEGEAAGDVTSSSYALHDGTHFKWPLMRAWVAAVEPEVTAALDRDARLHDVNWLRTEIARARVTEGAW